MRNKHANEKGIDIPKIIFGCIVVLLLLFCSGVTAVELSEEDMTASMAGAESYDDISFTDWTSSTSMPDVAGNYRLTGDVEIGETWNVSEGETNLDLNGYSITFVGSSGSVISVGNRVTLNLYDSVGTGKVTGGKVVNYGGGVYVNSNGNFNMHGGNISGNTVKADFYGNYGYGAGVYVFCDSNFTMSGGNITGNTAKHGGGVYVGDSSNFTMSGGNITGNTAGWNGGGVYVGDGNFTMSGGNISCNSKNNHGGGVYVGDGNFTMSGGNISCNSKNSHGGGVYVGNGKFTMYDGNITDNTANDGGGGVYVSYSYGRGTFSMHGGSITGNTVGYYGSGGGVHVYGSNFTMSGGNITDNNAQQSGGGVYVNSGKFTMSGGNIADNSANMNNGGGVYLTSSSMFTMSGGNIANNSANMNNGGGVHVNGLSNFNMYGGNITGNSASEHGGGVYVEPYRFKLSGGIIINNTVSGMANNVYLRNDKYTTVGLNGLLENTNIGVTTQNAPTESTPIAITGVNTRDYSFYFFADNSSYHIENIDNRLYLVYGEPKPPIQPLPTSLHLSRGWNFISIPLPLAASSDTAGELFADLATSGTSPLGYDASSDAGWYILNRDTILKPLDGYWLYVEEPTTLNLVYADAAAAGSSAAASVPSKQVYKGWNAIGVSAKESVKAKDAFDGLSWVRYLPWNLNADAWGRVIVNGGSAAESEENYVGLGNGGWLYVEANGVYRGVRMYVPIN